MFARDLHVLLAILTLLTVFVATVEAAVRTVRGHPAGITAGKIRNAVAISVLMTATAGLALLISGKHPKEWLHLIYVALAFALIPMSDEAATSLKSNRGRALARLGGGLTCLIVITRLFATG